MAWHPYDLDHLAQEIVLKARSRDASEKKVSLNQAYKMRAACAYGLERFWGEHLRLGDKKNSLQEDLDKAAFVADVWRAFVGIMAKSGITLPGAILDRNASEAEIQSVAEYLWKLEPEEQQASLAVLTSLCDAVVWWTQRLKTGKGGDD
jgi:hypothetical protein